MSSFAIPGAPPPRPNSTLAGPEKVAIAGSGAFVNREVSAESPRAGRTLSASASQSATERQEYIRETGAANTQRQERKLLDILV
jgi:hypothetical protein